MRKITFCLLLLGVLVVCCKKRENPIVELGPDDLAQTTWSGVDEFIGQNLSEIREHCIIEFRTTTTGTYIEVDKNGRPFSKRKFDYKIKGKLITFFELREDTWTVVDYTGESLILHAFLPEKHVMTLTKMY